MSLNQVLSNLNSWTANKKMALEALGLTIGANMEANAKVNASWINRTGMARRGLTGGFFWDGPNGIVYIAHTVEYGKWLELCNDGKYAILKPTRDKFAQVAFKSAERIMK